LKKTRALIFLNLQTGSVSGCDDMHRDVIETADEFSRDIAEV